MGTRTERTNAGHQVVGSVHDLATQLLATPGEVSAACRMCRKTVPLYLDLAGLPRVESHGRDGRPCLGGGMTPEGVADPFRVGPTWGYLTGGERGDGG